MTLGPVMLDLLGTELSAEEREMLQHPLVCGVILFTRNYESPEQLERLVADIHALREPRLLVCVDHEGGRVQRFRDGFTQLPPAAAVGKEYEWDHGHARRYAETMGWLMAAELRAVGVDFSFAPVLDLDRGVSQVIGDRAFGSDVDQVSDLAHSYTSGMHRAGMAAVGKHFPGHGGVAADSHVAIPVDDRRYEDILEDMEAFERLIGWGLEGIMPAHVIYAHVDQDHPAGFSDYWITGVLRGRLRFEGTVFSDDLDMAAAGVAGDFVERARAALSAGCDVALVCNNRDGAMAVLDGLEAVERPELAARLERMRGRQAPGREELSHSERWQAAVQLAARLRIT